MDRRVDHRHLPILLDLHLFFFSLVQLETFHSVSSEVRILLFTMVVFGVGWSSRRDIDCFPILLIIFITCFFFCVGGVGVSL